MRTRSVVAATLLAAVATLSMAGPAIARPADRDCPDFPSQAAAQAALDSRSGDPERLDADRDGTACESRFGEPASRTDRVGSVPRGAVDAGDGSAAGGSAASDSAAPVVLLLGGAIALGAAAAGARRATARG